MSFSPALLFALVVTVPGMSHWEETWVGRWSLDLDTPGGSLPFLLEVVERDGVLIANIVNGPERIPVEARHTGKSLVLDMPHFDSTVELEVSDDTQQLTGKWRKVRGKEEVATLDCTGARQLVQRFDPPDNFLGRWEVNFSESDDTAVGVFLRYDQNEVVGTFLTTTGDYRYLHGYATDGELQMSCFDGAHAFLFKAKLSPNGELIGNFWSGNWYEESWTATRNDGIQLPDGFTQTTTNPAVSLSDLAYPDLDGKLTSLGDSSFDGSVRIIEVFGSWCPNCHDAAKLMADLNEKYRDKGLRVVGLAFELTGEVDRDVRQLRRYRERFQIDYPILLAGLADKQKASEAFPLVDRVRSFPTTIFVDRGGSVRAIYSGFSGPATGEAHEQLCASFESLVKRLLEEK